MTRWKLGQKAQPRAPTDRRITPCDAHSASRSQLSPNRDSPVVMDRDDAGGRPVVTVTLLCSRAAPRAALDAAESRMGPPRPAPDLKLLKPLMPLKGGMRR